MALIYVIASDHTQLIQAPTLIDDVTGQMTALVLVPTRQGHLITKQWVDDTFIVMAPRNLPSTARGTYVTVEDIAALDDEIALLADQTDLVALQNDAVKLAGSTVTGPIIYAAAPLSDDELINKAFIDGLSDLIPDNILTEAVGDFRYLSKSGGTLTGPLVLPAADPASDLQVISKSYVDQRMPSMVQSLQRAGGTMTGPLVQARLPLKPFEIATKGYVDLWNDYLTAPIQPYIRSGAIIGVLHPFLGTLDSSGKLIGIKNAVKGHPEFDMTPTGSGQEMSDGAFWIPTASSLLGFAQPVSILSRHVVMGIKDDPLTGSVGVAYALNADGSYFEYRREMSGNSANIGARFRYHDIDGTDYELTTSKRGKPTQPVYTYEFFRNPGDDGMTGRIWDFAMNNLGVNGNPGIPQADGFIQHFGNRAVAAGLFPGKFGPIVVLDSAAPDLTVAKQAAVDWIMGLAALLPT